MRKWWWWFPGWHRKWKLEKRRIEALSGIVGERLFVELMAQRPRSTDDVIDTVLLKKVLNQLAEIHGEAETAIYKDDLDDLVDDAELQGIFAAHLCPAAEIHDEGVLAIDQIEGWSIPKAAPKKLRDVLLKKPSGSDPPEARSALYQIFAERVAWGDYIDDYEDTMRPWTHWLFVATISLPLLAALAFHFAGWFSPLLILGLLCAGASGSCVSVMSKMPALDVSLSGELDAYGRRVLGRIGVGVIASLIGSASLAWLPVSVKDRTFADALNAASTTGVKTLIVLGIPMLLGFSERTLTSFEQRVFGNLNNSKKG